MSAPLPVMDRLGTAVTERIGALPPAVRFFASGVVAAFVTIGSWRGGWWGMGALGVLLAFLAWIGWVMEQTTKFLKEMDRD